MPIHPIQHQIADQATARVREIWASVGAAAEEIRQDYGEDLLVQTCHDGKMDAARLWVQVKGVQAAPEMNVPDGRARIPVRADTALRWARTADLLLLVLWEVEGNRGWYSIPDFFDLHSELVLKDREPISLEVCAGDVFNAKSAERITWRARLDHLGGFIRNLRRWQMDEKQIDEGRFSWVDEAVIEAVIDMMIDLHMLDKRSGGRTVEMNPAFEKLFLKCVRKEDLSDNPLPNEVKQFDKWDSYAILHQISDMTGLWSQHCRH